MVSAMALDPKNALRDPDYDEVRAATRTHAGSPASAGEHDPRNHYLAGLW
jgi:hypothetical protein